MILAQPPVDVDVILDDTHHRLACCLIRDGQIKIFPSAIPPGWSLPAVLLATVHELTHFNLADAREDYRSEAYARYAERVIYDWLYSPVEYELLLALVKDHNARRD